VHRARGRAGNHRVGAEEASDAGVVGTDAIHLG
jgi:hypothetical protein